MIKKDKIMEKNINHINEFLNQATGLTILMEFETGFVSVTQKSDKKSISFKLQNIREILQREDSNKDSFLQINFENGKKVLLTKEFVGFSPALCGDLDIHKLPKVVTTADLLSVVEAIEGTLYNQKPYEENLSEVRMFFESIASGAESVGFDLTGERLWVEKLISNYPLLAKKLMV